MEKELSLRSERESVVIDINQQVAEIILNNGEDAEILISLSGRMDEIKNLMDSAPEEEIYMYCEQYNGFNIFLNILEDIASGISTGMISVPILH